MYVHTTCIYTRIIKSNHRKFIEVDVGSNLSCALSIDFFSSHCGCTCTPRTWH